MMELLASPDAWIAFLTLTMLELILGIDNIVFITILVDKLPAHQRELARRLGLGAAMFMRIGLLFVLSWIIGLKEPWFTILGHGISGRDLVLIIGGLFLLWKATMEIHELLEGQEGHASAKIAPTFSAVIVQIMLIDIVFSLDSIITAVGMVDDIEVMMLFAGPIGRFISARPTIKMLALSFLFLIGAVLIAGGFDHDVPKGYIYFAMAFSIAVEMLNIRLRKPAAEPVHLHQRYAAEDKSK